MYTLVNQPQSQPQPLPEPEGAAVPRPALAGIGETLSSPIVVIALAAGALWFLSREKPKPKKRRRKTRSPGDKAPGWYAIGYNYPRGHSSRRIKTVEGPFQKKETAEKRKAAEYKKHGGPGKGSWYMEVRRRETMP